MLSRFYMKHETFILLVNRQAAVHKYCSAHINSATCRLKTYIHEMQHCIRLSATRFSASTDVPSRNASIHEERNMYRSRFLTLSSQTQSRMSRYDGTAAWNWNFRASKDHHGPFTTGNGWNERLVIQPTSTVSSVPCVPWRSINRCSEFNVYTRNMYVPPVSAWLASYLQRCIPHAKFAFSHIASFLSTFRSIPHYLCTGYLISVHH